MTIAWTWKMLGKLGQFPDARLAKEWGVSPQTVSKKRREMGVPTRDESFWTPERISLLGKRSDLSLSRLWGKSPHFCRKKRIALDIPRHLEFFWKPEKVNQLGKRPDTSLAQEWGCSHMMVQRYRRKLGIPRYRKGQARLVRVLSLSPNELEPKFSFPTKGVSYDSSPRDLGHSGSLPDLPRQCYPHEGTMG